MAAPFLQGAKPMWLLARGFFTTWPGMITLGALAFFAYQKAHDWKLLHKERAAVARKVAEHAKTAEAARRSVADAPADSLRDAWTRD